MAKTTGIRQRGSAWEAWVWSRRDHKKIYRTFPTQAAAKGWRADATSALHKGMMRAPSAQTVEQAAKAWIAKAEAGEVKKRAAATTSPPSSAATGPISSGYVIPALGAYRVSQLRRRDVQELLVDDLVRKTDDHPKLWGSTVLNVLNALRAVLRRALRGDELAVDPTKGLELPEGPGVRDRAASPAEAEELLAALPDEDRPLWATACYAGLRGELRALRWSDVDLEANVIAVARGWDEHEGEIAPKSKERARRMVPIAEPLCSSLLEQRALTGRRGSDLVFGRTASAPFTPTHIRKRALKAWAAENVEREGEGAAVARADRPARASPHLRLADVRRRLLARADR